jgi:hypothetical protein
LTTFLTETKVSFFIIIAELILNGRRRKERKEGKIVVRKIEEKSANLSS